MTPDERDRLVRLEERVQNIASDTRKASELIGKLFDRIDAQDSAINRIEIAVTGAAKFTAGGWWVFTKIVALILAGLGALGWLTDHLPQWLHGR